MPEPFIPSIAERLIFSSSRLIHAAIRTPDILLIPDVLATVEFRAVPDALPVPDVLPVPPTRS